MICNRMFRAFNFLNDQPTLPAEVCENIDTNDDNAHSYNKKDNTERGEVAEFVEINLHNNPIISQYSRERLVD